MLRSRASTRFWRVAHNEDSRTLRGRSPVPESEFVVGCCMTKRGLPASADSRLIIGGPPSVLLPHPVPHRESGGHLCTIRGRRSPAPERRRVPSPLRSRAATPHGKTGASPGAADRLFNPCGRPTTRQPPPSGILPRFFTSTLMSNPGSLVLVTSRGFSRATVDM